MNKKVLVTYASKYGATAEIAQNINHVLVDAGLDSEISAVKNVGDLTPYDAVILGSAVYIGQWRKEAEKFIQANQNKLAGKEVWLFSSGPTGEGDPVELLDGWNLPKGVQEFADRIHPQQIAVFHGDVDQDKLNRIEKFMVTKVESPTGDYRNWDSITAWANEIAETLKQGE